MNKFYISMGLLVVMGLVFGIYRQATLSRHVVVVYSPMPDAFMEGVNRLFEKRYPDITVQTVHASTTVLENHIRSEKSHPVGDVMYAGDLPTYLELKKEKLIHPIDLTIADRIPDTMKDPDKTWYAVYQMPIIPFYNDTLLSAEQAPKDWKDLLAPALDDAIMLRNPTQSGMARALYLGLINVWGEGIAFEFFKKLNDQVSGQYVGSTDKLLEAIARGEAKVGVADEGDVWMSRFGHQSPLMAVYPTNGACITPEPMAMLEGAPHPDAALKYIEFVMDFPALEFTAGEFFKRPARTDYPIEKLPVPLQTPIKALPVNWLSIGNHGAEWLKKWRTEIWQPSQS